jgi:hypothetical protein
MAMPHTEGLGKTGWAALAFLLLGILAVVIWGFGAAVYIGLFGTAVALVIMVLLCLGDTVKFGR